MGTLLRAVIVGINDYADTSYRDNAHLLFAKKDAMDVAEAIPESTAYSIESANFHVLVNNQATGRVIRDAMSTTFGSRSFDHNTIALFYFAGHIVRSGGRLIICSYDVNFSDPEHGGIRLNDIYDYLLSSSAECVIAIVDGCFSGGLVNARHSFISTNELLKQAVELQRGPDGKTVALFAASRSDQESHEKKRLRHGIFTHELLQGLFHGEARDPDGTVSLFGLTNFLSKRFQNEKQQPRFSVLGDRSIVLWHAQSPTLEKHEQRVIERPVPSSPGDVNVQVTLPQANAVKTTKSQTNLSIPMVKPSSGYVYVPVKIPTMPATSSPPQRRSQQALIMGGILMLLMLCAIIGFIVIYH